MNLFGEKEEEKKDCTQFISHETLVRGWARYKNACLSKIIPLCSAI